MTSEKGRILPAKDIDRAAREAVRRQKRNGFKPDAIYMNPDDVADVRRMRKRYVMCIVGVPIEELGTMPRGKLGFAHDTKEEHVEQTEQSG